MLKINKLLVLIAAATWSLSMNAKSELTNLCTIGLCEPIGIESTPTFSWEISSLDRGVRQSAYQISVNDATGTTVWNSGRVESSRQTDIPYSTRMVRLPMNAGAPLKQVFSVRMNGMMPSG